MKPTRVLRFDADAFGAQAVCLGSQVAAIVARIDAVVPDLCWYVADVECVGLQFTARAPAPVRLGDARAFRHVLQGVDQFMSGVFAGVPDRVAQPRFREDELWTDDDESAVLGDAVVEVRAVDTTYLSIGSSHQALLENLLDTDFTKQDHLA